MSAISRAFLINHRKCHRSCNFSAMTSRDLVKDGNWRDSLQIERKQISYYVMCERLHYNFTIRCESRRSFQAEDYHILRSYVAP